MEYGVLIEIWCSRCDLVTLSKLSSLNREFYSTITITKIKDIIGRFELQPNIFLSLRDCYELNHMKETRCKGISEYIKLCVQYDRTYLLDDLINEMKRRYREEEYNKITENFTNKILDVINFKTNSFIYDRVFLQVCDIKRSIQENPVLLEYFIVRQLVYYDCSGFCIDYIIYLLKQYIKVNNFKTADLILSGAYNYDYKLSEFGAMYKYCKTEEMFLLLKKYGIKCIDSSIYDDEDDISWSSLEGTTMFKMMVNYNCGTKNIVDWLIKHGDYDEKQLIVYIYLGLRHNLRSMDDKIISMCEGGFNRYIDDFLFRLMIKNKDSQRIINICKYDSIKDKILLLEVCNDICKDECDELVLNIMFKHGHIDDYLNKNYFDVKRSKVEIIDDLIEEMEELEY